MWMRSHLLLRIWVGATFKLAIFLKVFTKPPTISLLAGLTVTYFREDCCSDYTSLCGIHNIEPRIDSVPWPSMGFLLAGLLMVMAATTSLILLLSNKRRRDQDIVEEEFAEDEMGRGEGRVVMVEGDCGETFDFRLSTTEEQPAVLGPCQMYTTI